MTLFEFFVFGIYLAMLLGALVGIQYLESLKPVQPRITVLDTDEKFVQSELEEPNSDDEVQPFNPEKESYTMTENPMLRHRNINNETESSAPNNSPAMEMVD